MKASKMISIITFVFGLVFLPIYWITDNDVIGFLGYFSLVLTNIITICVSVIAFLKKRKRENENKTGDGSLSSDE